MNKFDKKFKELMLECGKMKNKKKEKKPKGIGKPKQTSVIKSHYLLDKNKK
jgi:hypothetical protein